jgi:hypothetical protein
LLLGRRQSVSRRIRAVLFATLAAFAPAVIWYTLARWNIIDWPKASGPVGVGLGLFGGLIVLFEMALAPRKWFRGWRGGATRVWMRWHVWLGLLCIPVIVIHSGFALGGWLSAVTMVLFLFVIASGVGGLLLQQWLPKKLFDDIPNETVASQVHVAIQPHRDEARQLAESLRSQYLNDFYRETLDPFLTDGPRSGSILNSAAESVRIFARLRAAVPAEIEPAVERFEHFARFRRQWDRQVRITWWLHSWLVIHLPLSVAMTGFMIGHAILAMRWY